MSKAVILPLIAIIAMASVFLIVSSAVTVPAGTKGVLLTWGKATGTLDEGLHFVIPIAQSVVIMDTTIHKVETVTSAASRDLQDVTTSIAVNYHIDSAYVLDIYVILRNEYESRLIKPNIEETIKAVTADFVAENLITNRTTVKIQFENLLAARLNPFHIQIDSISITNFEFSPDFKAAIESKVTAEQRALEAKNKLEQIRYEAQQQVIQASAYANATITKAEADSKAIKLLQLQLTPEYIQYLAMLRWDGKLPYLMGGGAVPFINIPTGDSISP